MASALCGNGSKNSVEKLPDLDLFRQHLCQQRAQRTCVSGMFFELFADIGAKERGPELGPSLTKTGRVLFWSHSPQELEVEHDRFGHTIDLVRPHMRQCINQMV